jgi:hypothetical protein
MREAVKNGKKCTIKTYENEFSIDFVVEKSF